MAKIILKMEMMISFLPFNYQELERTSSIFRVFCRCNSLTTSFELMLAGLCFQLGIKAKPQNE